MSLDRPDFALQDPSSRCKLSSVCPNLGGLEMRWKVPKPWMIGKYISPISPMFQISETRPLGHPGSFLEGFPIPKNLSESKSITWRPLIDSSGNLHPWSLHGPLKSSLIFVGKSGLPRNSKEFHPCLNKSQVRTTKRCIKVDLPLPAMPDNACLCVCDQKLWQWWWWWKELVIVGRREPSVRRMIKSQST